MAFIAQWLISIGLEARLVAMAVLPTTIGSCAGMAIAGKRKKSTLAGTILGGVLASLICPIVSAIYLWISEEISFVEVPVAFFMFGVSSVIFAFCGSALFAAVVGVLREGITISRNPLRLSR